MRFTFHPMHIFSDVALVLIALLLLSEFLSHVLRRNFRSAIESAGSMLDQLSAISFSILAAIEILAVIGSRLPLTTPDTAQLRAAALQHFARGMGWTAAALLIWGLREKAKREPTAPGQLFAYACMAWGVVQFLQNLVREKSKLAPIVAFVGGSVFLVVTNTLFRRRSGEHRILEHVAARGDVLQPEYHRATPECPEPERWRMYDSMTAEYEVLQFLQQLVETLKPKLIVETGTFMGISTLWLAQGLRANGAGKVITCEYDPVVYAKAVERIDASGLKEWIDARNESSLEMQVSGEVDMLFTDSDPGLREAEVRRFLPLLRANGVILIHDASSHLRTVRDAALKLEREGLISLILLPTPRGLVLAQKRAGRTE